MADIFEKFKSVVGATVNDALDKAEDPVKVSKREVGKLTTKLETMRTEIVAVMADKDSTEDDIKEVEKEINILNTYIDKASAANNASDVMQLVERRLSLEDRKDELTVLCSNEEEHIKELQKEYVRLSGEVRKAKTRQRNIAGKVATANMKTELIASGASSNNIHGIMGKFKAMEDKADRMAKEAKSLESMETLSVDPLASIKQGYQTSMQTRVAAEMERIGISV